LKILQFLFLAVVLITGQFYQCYRQAIK